MDVLILSKVVHYNATADLSDLIYKQTKGRYRVTLLIHTPSQLKIATHKNGYLLHSILKTGWLLQTEIPLAELRDMVLPHRLSAGQVKKFTSSRLYHAQKLFTMEDTVQGIEGGVLRATLLHMGVEQLCLAIIYAFMGYYPNHFHLAYLFSLCSHCTPLLNDLFPDTSEEDRELLKILHTTPQALRFKKSEQFIHTQLQVLEGRCWRLFSKTEKLIQKRIDALQ